MAQQLGSLLSLKSPTVPGHCRAPPPLPALHRLRPQGKALRMNCPIRGQRCDYIHAQDAARALVLGFQRSAARGVSINVGSG